MSSRSMNKTTSSRSSSARSKHGARVVTQTPIDAKLHVDFEESERFDYSTSVDFNVSSSTTNVPSSTVSAYLHRMQRGSLIQPFGCMIAVDEQNFTVLAYSENAPEMLDLAPHAVPSIEQKDALDFGADVRTLFRSSGSTALQKAANFGEVNLLNPILVHCRASGKPFYAILHRIDIGLVIDLEPVNPADVPVTAAGALKSYKLAAKAISRFQSLPSGNISLLCDILVKEVSDLTGYDRVMVYKFHEDEHGEVIAECRRPDLEPYLGLHYPATDIPQASRFLFMKNKVRMICDCLAPPVKVVQDKRLSQPLSLAGSTLRSPHGCHAQYMANMGSMASLVMSVTINEDDEGIEGNQQKGKKLWGLVVCHHTSPRFVPFPLRYACEFLIQVFSVQINKEVELAAQLREKHILRTQTVLCDMLLRDAPVGIVIQSPNVMDLVKCDGAALYYQKKFWLLGVTPTEAQIREITEWLLECHNGSTGLSTDSLVEAGYPGASALGDEVCGMAAVRITSKDFLFWFRSHTAKEIKWGGAKHDPDEKDDGRKMHPRSSFKAFLEVVKRRSLPWEDVEMDAIHSLQLILRGSLPDEIVDECKMIVNVPSVDDRLQRVDELRIVTNEMIRLIETAAVPILAVDASGCVNGSDASENQHTWYPVFLLFFFGDEKLKDAQQVQPLCLWSSRKEEGKMSTRLLRTLTDENQDLQKQIGCMNGIFQLFDRHNFLGGRCINSRSHKRLLPGQNGNQGTEPDTALQKNTGRNPKLVKEKKQVSTESSKTSLSSSTSSSFSSLDYKTAQFEPPSSNQLIFSKTLARPMNKQNASLLSSPRSLDLREVVKGSINREVRTLSIKTAGKEDAAGSTLTYIDSPRPLQPTKSVCRASGLNNSARNPAKPWGASRNHKEEKDGLMLSSLKDAPRLSYDGRVSQEVSKSTIRLKELPRLSLDSREGSLRGTASETTKNFLLKDLHRRNGNSSTVLNQQQEPESSKPPSSIIAKLMGLEAFPQSTATTANPLGIISSCRTTKSPSPESYRTIDGNKQNRICGSPRNLQKDPIAVRLKNDDSVLSPTSKSKLRTQPTPWRQPHGCQSSQQTAFNYGEATSRASNSSPSVYGEIEKRLAELEFKKSGKDLRALKQILEAMQKTKGALETKSEQASNFDSQTSTNRVSHQSSTLASPRRLKNKDPISSTVEGLHSPKSYKSPVVVMKPVNLTRRTSDRASSTIPTGSMSGLCKHGHTENGRNIDMRTSTDLTPRSNHLKDNFSRLSCSTDKHINVKTSKSTPALKVSRRIIRENTKSSETVSPRPQQRKLGLQKQSPPTIPSSDSSKTMRQHSRQPMGSDSRDRQLGPKSPSLQQCNDQSSESSSDWRDPSHQGDTVSLQSESNISSCSHINREITSSNQSDKTTSSFQQDGLKEKNPERFSGDRVMVEPAIATLEQPSPVSVLDATFYRDESPSPVKKISNAFKDYEAQDDDEEEWIPIDHAQPKYTISSFSADSVNQKSKSTHHLLQNLPQIDCTGEEPITNYIAALNEDTNSDHRYVSEILLASGLLRDLDFGSMTTHLQTSGHPLSSNLFLALEQKNTSAGLLNDKQSNKRILKSEPSEKIQRILIFDIVNEILVRKLLLEGPPQQWFSPNMLAGRKPRGQQLLEELCSELDQLQNNNPKRSLHEEDDSLESIIWENLMHHSMDWNCNHEIPNLVLDLERLIFKDLITEVVNSEGAGLQGQPGGRCRKLFSM